MANVDRQAIDKLRKAQNLPPLTDAEFSSLEGNGHDDEEARIAAEQKAAEEKAELERLAKLEEEKNKPKELTDEELMEKIAQKTGRKVASWDDLKPTKEIIDEENAKQEREQEKWSWAYKNKVVKKDEHENFISDSKDAKNLVYRLRLEEAKKEDPNLDEKEFEAEFNEEFGIEQDPKSRRYKNGQTTLNNLANQVLKNTYGSIYSLEDKYSQFEKVQAAQREQEKKIKEGAPVYKQALDKVKTDLKKIKAHISESEEYEVEVLDESINEVLEMMSDPQWAAQKIVNGYTPEELKDIAWTAVLKKNWPTFANEIKKQALLKNAAGTKGIAPIMPSGSGDDYELTDAQKKLKSLIEQNSPAPAAAN